MHLLEDSLATIGEVASALLLLSTTCFITGGEKRRGRGEIERNGKVIRSHIKSLPLNEKMAIFPPFLK
jgi:hypothetical protein